MVTEVKIGSLVMKNPVTTGSGTFGYGEEISEFYPLSELGAVTVKGTSLLPREGNPYQRTCETVGGVLNAIGLQNPGFDKVAEEKIPFLRKQNVPIILNIIGSSLEEYEELAQKCNGLDIDAVEINVSCPNVKAGCMAFGTSKEGIEAVVGRVKNKYKGTVITKLSPNVTDIAEMALAAEGAGSDAVSLVNTFMGCAIDPRKRKFVLANKTGGLSGPCIKPIALRMVWQTAKAVKIPIIGQGGIMTGEDAIEFIMAGATAVSVGTGNLVNPMCALNVVRGIEKFMKEENIDNINDIIKIID
ncbi:MAG: dihydroorotate dehydrogenase [Armatimonadetes bacterium]|nr:dihydroorotate dehydrogenase [Candidatus Hippobium faecium]